MLRNLNATKRRAISTGDYQLTLKNDSFAADPYFELELDLKKYKFPSSARICVEAWRGNVSKRWDFGTIDHINLRDTNYRRLDDMSVSLNFRITVISSDIPGLILGEAKTKVRFSSSLDQQSFLPIELKDDMVEVWRLDYNNSSDEPVLQLNQKMVNVVEEIRKPGIFRSTILPAVLRSVLTRILIIDKTPLDINEIETDQPSFKWLNFADGIVSVETIKTRVEKDGHSDEDVEEILDWIEIVVEKFSNDKLQINKIFSG